MARGCIVSVVLIALVSSAASCSDTNRAFTGRWVSAASLDSDWLVGRPELAIGHFGPEVTGVAWFLDEDGIENPICPCEFIDHRAVDLDRETLVVSTTFCDGSLWLWRLALEEGDGDEPALVGTVEVSGDATRVLDVRLELLSTFIPNERKRCE